MRTLRFAALGLALMSTIATAGARDDLAAFTKGLRGLDGHFSQQVYDPSGKLKETSSGRVALSAPRLFRWEYAKPYEQLIVADGKTVWVYDPDLQQVTKRPQGVEEASSPLAALVDPSRLDRDYTVKDAGREDGLDWLLLTPKSGTEASFQSARLGFGAQGLVRMQVVDAVGQKTRIVFDGWQRNPGFAANTFRFTPAKGVDIVGD